MKNILRRLRIFFLGVVTFKSWVRWILYRFEMVVRDEREREFKVRDGTTFYFRPKLTSGAGLFQEIYLQNNYFENYSLKPGDVVIDVGAHIGIFSIFAATRAKNVKVFAYEPIPELFRLLEKNIAKNDLGRIIKPCNLGVAKERGVRNFFGQTMVKEVSYHPKLGCTWSDKDAFSVHTVSLANIFVDNRIEYCDFLKMDCEGAEFEIILNSPKKILDKISHMTIEYHLEPKKLVDYLSRNGFGVKIGEVLSNDTGMLYADKAEVL